MKKISQCVKKFVAVCLFCTLSPVPAWALDSLSNAALAGDKAKLEALIAKGAKVKGEEGISALYWATIQGKYDAAVVLIEHGADVNGSEPNYGVMPLHEAVWWPKDDTAFAQNKKKIAEFLIDHGADVNAKGKSGTTPLHYASTKEMVALLINHGANVNADAYGNTPIFDAISRNYSEAVEALIAHGADVNYKSPANGTPLHYAVSQNHKAIVKLLVEHGADLGAKDRDGETPLNIAVRNNSAELVTLLMANGNQLNTKPKNGLAELHWAVSQGNKSMVDQLLVHGAQINAADQYGRTPLHLAAEYKHEEIAKLLIAHGADVSIKSQNNTPLILGIRDKEMMELLLKHGADANAKDAHGDSLLWHVCYDNELAELLLKHGANINIKNSQGRTVLHLAARFARDNVEKWLLAHGADVKAKDDYGRTPLFQAVGSFERYPAPPRASRPIAISSTASDSKRAESKHSSPPISSADDLNSAFPSGLDTSNSMTTVKVLLAHGADVSATDRQGQSLLHVAPTKDIAELLLARGVAVNAKRTDGATALHLAAVYGRREVVQALLAHGADVNARTKDGITPLHYANGSEIVKLLLASGADANAADSGGNTPLYMADEPVVVELLLLRGAALNTKNAHGQTPLLNSIRIFISNLPAHGLMYGPLGDPMVVAHGGSKEVIKALLDRGADVNVVDTEGYMPLFYVREAIKSYREVADQLHAVEGLLLARGAKLEKLEKKSSPQLQQNFPPELAGMPQIALGTRVMMQLAIQYEERRKAGKENPLYFREPGAVSSATDKLKFEDHFQLLDYFQNLPADTQNRGLWIKRMVRNLWIQQDAERLDTLTQQAQLRKISLFVCEPKENKTRSSWLVTWECDQVSPKRGVKTLSCEAMESKGQPARWECKNK